MGIIIGRVENGQKIKVLSGKYRLSRYTADCGKKYYADVT